MLKKLFLAGAALCAFSTPSMAGSTAPSFSVPATCANLERGTAASINVALRQFLTAAVTSADNAGFGYNMWATLVANDGTVCGVAFSGANYTEQWLASRVISAQKAATANSLSLPKLPLGGTGKGALALATANLYSATRDGGSLFGLQFSNPVDTADAYHGVGHEGAPTTPDPASFGAAQDPMVGRPIGGINVFGGGLALYNAQGKKVGGVGVSGDTSCTDHMVAWRLRHAANLDFLATAGVSGPAAIFAGDATHPDNIIFDIPAAASTVTGSQGLSVSGFGHPTCPFQPAIDPGTKTAANLPAVQ